MLAVANLHSVMLGRTFIPHMVRALGKGLRGRTHGFYQPQSCNLPT